MWQYQRYQGDYISTLTGIPKSMGLSFRFRGNVEMVYDIILTRTYSRLIVLILTRKGFSTALVKAVSPSTILNPSRLARLLQTLWKSVGVGESRGGAVSWIVSECKLSTPEILIHACNCSHATWRPRDESFMCGGYSSEVANHLDHVSARFFASLLL